MESKNNLKESDTQLLASQQDKKRTMSRIPPTQEDPYLVSEKLPEKIKKIQGFLQTKTKDLKSRLVLALDFLTETKFVSKENKDKYEIKIKDIKQKPTNLDKLDVTQYYLIMNFVQDVYDTFVEPRKNTFSKEKPFLNELDASRTECLQLLAVLVVICYSKLFSSQVVHFEDTKLLQEYKQNKLRITSHLLMLIFLDPTIIYPSNLLEMALFFSEIGIKDLMIQLPKEKTAFQDDCLENYQSKKCSVENMVFSVLGLCQIAQKFLEQDFKFFPEQDQIAIAKSVAEILKQLFRLTDKLHTVFFSKIIDFSEPQFLLGFDFKTLFLIENTAEYYKMSSLLNIVALTTIRFLEKSNFGKNRGNLQQQEIDEFDKVILSNIDKIFLRQIMIYQSTERVPTEESKSPDTKEQTSLLKNALKQIGSQQQLGVEQLSQSIIMDREWLTQVLKEKIDPVKQYLLTKDEQLDWMRINSTLYKVTLKILPRFYAQQTDQNQQMRKPQSYMSHIYDLMRIQIVFILRFQHNQPWLISLPDLHALSQFLPYDCALVLTIRLMFSAMVEQQKNLQFNTVVLSQIYFTLSMISNGFFKSYDQQNYLKVQFLLFMNQLDAQIFNDEQLTKNKVFSGLFGLFKTDFYAEKYVRIFEKIKNLDKVVEVLQLQEIVSKLEQKRTDDDKTKAIDPILFVNNVLVQQQALQLIVNIATKNEHFHSQALTKIMDEIQNYGLQQCDPYGAIYIERCQVYTNQSDQEQISTTEYVLVQSGTFSSYLYQCLKLSLGLIVQNVNQHYDILVMYQSVGQAQNNCADDVLISNFQKISLQTFLKPDTLIRFYQMLMSQLKSMSQSLEKQDQEQSQILGANQLKQLVKLQASEIKNYLSQLRQSLATKYDPQSQRIENKSVGFMIVQKVCSMIMRFLLYCSQHPALAFSIIEGMGDRKTLAQQKSQRILSEPSTPNQIPLAHPKLVTNLKEIVNLEFRLLLLRNVLFQLDPYDEQAGMLFELLKDTIKAIKLNFKSHIEQNTEFQNLTKKLYPFEFSNEPFTAQRSTSTHKLQIVEFAQLLQNKRAQFKKLAEICVSIISLYIKVVRKKEESLKLFERKTFIESGMYMIQSYVESEKTYISELIQAALQVYLFRQREDTNPFKLNKKDVQISLQMITNTNYSNQVSIINERYLDFILSTVIDFIQITCPDQSDLSIRQVPHNPEQLQKLLHSIKIIFEELNKHVVVKVGDTIYEKLTADLIKLQQSIRPETIVQLKRIFIFLKEQKDVTTVESIIKQLCSLLVRLFGMVPKAQQMRDFFSFFREILYYNQSIDDVDFSLLQEILSILNSSLTLRMGNSIQSESGQKETASQRIEQIDHFIFSTLTPGILLLNSLECNKDMQICLTFKISHEVVVNGQLEKKKLTSMTLLSLHDKSDETTQLIGKDNEPRLALEIDLLIDIENNSFSLKDPYQQQTQFKKIPISNKWHLLILRINRRRPDFSVAANLIQIEAYVGKFSQDSRVNYGSVKSDLKAKFLLALGNSVDYCISPSKPESNKHFKGRCSLPIFLQNIPEPSKCEAQAQQGLISAIYDQINSRQLLNIKGLDIGPKFIEDGSQKKKTNQHQVVDVQSLDHLTQAGIIMHQLLNKFGYICAVHCRRTSEVFVSIGGYKNMYPIIGRVIKSNIIDLGSDKPSNIFSRVIKVMGTLLNSEPQHMSIQMQKSSLIWLLKYCTLKIGTNRMLTAEFLSEIKNLFRNNISVQSVMNSTLNLQQQGSRILDTQRLPLNLIDTCPSNISCFKAFYDEFLSNLFHQIILDTNILSLPCLIVTSNSNYDVSQTESSDPECEKPFSTNVFNQIVELIHSILCPDKYNNQFSDTRTNQNKDQQSVDLKKLINSNYSGYYPTDSSTGQMKQQSQKLSFCNYSLLREKIVKVETVPKLVEILQKSPFNQIQNLSQLRKIGASISATILYQENWEQFQMILKQTILEQKAFSKVTLYVYLQVILGVVGSDIYMTKQKLINVQEKSKEFSPISLANILYQFESQPLEQLSEEGENLNDQIISVTIMLLVRLYANKRTKFRQVQFSEKVSQFDADKKTLLKIITDQLSKNSKLMLETYLTLMYLTFNKSKPLVEIPNYDMVFELIKNCKVRSDQRSYQDIVDFDIDFFFVVLENLPKYTDDTKLIVITNLQSFFRKHYSTFMKVYAGQINGDIPNPFQDHLPEFYYKIVKLQLNSEDKRIVQSTLNFIVEICSFQFLKCNDDLSEQNLGDQDEWGLQLFRKIIVYFDSSINTQQILLQKIIATIQREMNKDKIILAQHEQIKLNLKVIHLLQFFEELYARSPQSLNQLNLFQETLMSLMFLFEQLGLLTLDLPDKISIDKATQKSKLYSASITDMKPPVLQPTANQRQPDIFVSVDEQILNIQKLKGQKTQFQNVNKNDGSDYEKSQRVLPTTNFVSGGPARIFLHILFSSLTAQGSHSAIQFQNSIEMLRYLILRERGPFFMKTISNCFSPNFAVQPVVPLYNLFNRLQKLKEIKDQNKGMKKQEKNVKDSTLSQRFNELQPQPILDLIQAEIKIFKITVEGIKNYTKRKQVLEQINNGYQADSIPSQRDIAIVEKCLQNIQDKNQIGFTSISGFLLLQLIGEFMEILNHIVSNQDQPVKSNSEQFSQYFSNTSQLSDQQIQQTITNETKFQNILQLLKFLFNCMQAEFFEVKTETVRNLSGKTQIVNMLSRGAFYDNITNHLQDMSERDSFDAKQKVTFMCNFLEVWKYDQNDSDFDCTESQPEYQFEEKQQKQQNTLQFLNAYGYTDVQLSQLKTTTNKKINQIKSSSSQKLDAVQETEKEENKELPRQSQLQKAKTTVFQSNSPQKNLEQKQVMSTNNETTQLQNVIQNMSESASQDSNRSSWISSIKSEISMKSAQRLSSVSNLNNDLLQAQNLKERLTGGDADSLQTQYQNQIVDYIYKLFLELFNLSSAQTDLEKQDATLRIITQTLCKKKQCNIYIAFAYATTSKNFRYELQQVKLNSDATFKKIQREIESIINRGDLTDRKNLVENVQKKPINLLMQSQVLSRQPNKLLESSSTIQFQQNDAIGSQSQRARMQSNENNGFSLSLSTVNLTDRKYLAEDQNPLFSVQDPIISIEVKYCMEYQHTKYYFKKMLKRLTEDESSLWYDHVEEQQSEFREIKEIYDLIQSKIDENQVETTESRLANHRRKLEDIRNQQRSLDVEQILDCGSIVQNPKQRAYFVCQRRMIDTWGRMMLIKPNRKALDYKSWLYYNYFVFDFVNKMFAVSLFTDDQWPDLVKPQGRLQELAKIANNEELASLSQTKKAMSTPNFTNQLMQIAGEQNQRDSVTPSNNKLDGSSVNSNKSEGGYSENETPQMNDFKENRESPKAYSVFLQQMRQDFMQRMEKNRLLIKVLTNEDLFRNKDQEKPDLILRRKEKILQILENEKDNKARLFEAQSIRVNGLYWGNLLITKQYFYFLSACTSTPEETEYKFVEKRTNSLEKKELILQWSSIDEIMKRKILNVFQGIDVTTQDKKIYTFNLCSEQKCDSLIAFAKQFLPESREADTFKIITDPRSYLTSDQGKQIVTEWKNGQRSNIEFLMAINKYSGRSFNDLTQYYIFPWVLNDYSSLPVLFNDNLKNKSDCYRDLTKHNGNISDIKTTLSMEEFEESSDCLASAFQYGQGAFHLKFGMSNSNYVAQLLCRLEPYTSVNLQLSDLKIEHRLPIDFQLNYNNFLETKQSSYEILPEFFYFPEFLMNLNKLGLGNQTRGSTHLQQDSMLLPPWAMNQYDFVRIMREALESKQITSKLGHWIDYVFGIHQNSEEKLNKYPPCAYEAFFTEEKRKDEEAISFQHISYLSNFYTSPSKVFKNSLVQSADSSSNVDKAGNLIDQQNRNINQLIKAFVENYRNKRKLYLGEVAVHNYIEAQTHIVHMLFNNQKKCLVFVRQEDADRKPETGNIVVYLTFETLSQDNLKNKSVDLKLRYEWVSEELNNVFQINCIGGGNKLFVCGYLDNSIRIFDLDGKSGNHLIKVLKNQHYSRVTCLKFSADFRQLITCDSDGVILHYEQQAKSAKAQQSEEWFPYQLRYKLQDQMDEIVAIDTNQTLDMYCTLSRDGTIAVRCQRTSKLLQHFKIFCKTQKQKGQEASVSSFAKTFRNIYALRISLHGYIIVVGAQPDKHYAKYLVYSLSGDVLLREHQEKSTIKGVFLNATEDQLIIAQNVMLNNVKQGNIRVVKLYSLERLANLSQVVYSGALHQISLKNQNQQAIAAQDFIKDKTPAIQVIAMKKGEASLNIFFESTDTTPPTKEIICFQTSKLPVWEQLQDLALAPRRQE